MAVPPTRTPSESIFIEVRGLRYHVRCWGPLTARRVLMLHGWMDVSASFQLLVDALQSQWRVLAPDWRGFGLTDWAHDGYWFHDYVADLDRLLERLCPDEPVRLVGHSLGGNVACMYAGVRPDRVVRLVSLEGFGVRCANAAEAPARIAKWLDALRAPPALRPYASFAAVADRLQRSNPHLQREPAEFLARHWARETEDGSVVLNADPRHRIPFPTRGGLEEWLACWRAIEAPVLWVTARESFIHRWLGGEAEEWERRKAAVRNLTLAQVEGAGHMMHIEQPRELARIVEAFLESA